MDLATATEVLARGGKVARAAWPEGEYLEARAPKGEPPRLEHILHIKPGEKPAPFDVSQSTLMPDWREVEVKTKGRKAKPVDG